MGNFTEETRSEKSQVNEKENKKILGENMSYQNYYFILPYAKKFGTFFASDIKEILEKNDIYFSVAAIRWAIKYWIAEGCIKVLPTKYYADNKTTQIKKYIYIKDPE